MKITLNLTEEQLVIITRALKQASERYSVSTGDANRDAQKNWLSLFGQSIVNSQMFWNTCRKPTNGKREPLIAHFNSRE